MDVMPLGAGNEVGRSCIVVTIGDKTIMFDCGMHMGYNDDRKFPDFTCLSKTGNFDHILDCIIISHFHLDHCGALPYLTERLGFKGPIIMTHPTRTVLPALLEDSRRIMKGSGGVFSEDDIEKCMKKVLPIHMKETLELFPGLKITPYYAGQVLGAAMFHVTYQSSSIVYTGDYNTTADRHLSAACIPLLKPDLLISESTYGGVVRESRRGKEREFLQLIHSCIKRNGVVQIPVFALGRAQELCLLIETYWERMGWSVPVYFAGGLTKKANNIFKRFINYTNESTRRQICDYNVFEFKSIKEYERNVEMNGPCVIFSSPAMLHSGHSLKIFKNICEDPRNLVILPGYCVRGTTGDKILSGAKELSILGEVKKIKLQVENLAFSAHADTLGIRSLIRQCNLHSIMLVHGDKTRIKTLKSELTQEFNLPVFTPDNVEIINIHKHSKIPVKIQDSELADCGLDLSLERQDFSYMLSISNNSGIGIIDSIEKCSKFLEDADS